MTVRRWRFVDPHDDNPATKTYIFPYNPREMTSPYPDRAIATMGTPRGRTLLFEGAGTAKQWSFSGPILDKDHYEALRTWVYKRPGRVVINDHYGRKIDCVLTSLEVVPKRRIGYYYSHEYSVTVLTIGILAPEVPNEGPG